MSGKFVSYLRVSTEKQGRSGLGLEAQRLAVAAFIGERHASLVAEFVEVESGRKNARPSLAEALATCRLHKGILVVAKLDRLSRDAHFLLGLKDSGVEFVCCDMPAANRLTVGIMAIVAEEEARLISTRTKAALLAAKARGVKLGTPNLSKAVSLLGCKASAVTRRRAALQRATDLLPLMKREMLLGCSGPTRLAEALNRERIPAPRGGRWSPSQARRLLVTLPGVALK
jgi:DNA invertase Pin-like site-specific DNA recombinase